LSQEREHASLALNFQFLSIGGDFKRITLSTRKTIGGAENLHWTNEIQLFDWRHNDDDDSTPSDRDCSQVVINVYHVSHRQRVALRGSARLMVIPSF
jgi:hypothetical protein